jgi:hypothetical protein
MFEEQPNRNRMQNMLGEDTIKGLSLSLADGRLWFILAGDDRITPVISHLGKAMCLQKGDGAGKKLISFVSDLKKLPPLPNGDGDEPLVCVLGPHDDGDLIVIWASMLSLVIACDAQHRGGILVHGALASFRGEGIILAASSGTGKTTASKRLPSPWSSLSDDATLVVRDPEGRYWAHPWPTWSCFYRNGPGGSWNVEEAVPLRAIFFLSRSEDERVEPLRRTQTVAMLMESAKQATQTVARSRSPEEACEFHNQQLEVVTAMASQIPAYLLHLSLTGEFWRHIEEVLSNENDRHAGEWKTHTTPGIVEPQLAPQRTHGDLIKNDPIPVIYRGPSMNPTLWEPDLLEVVPYQGRPMKRGDVVYFRRPSDEQMVVHRIMEITPRGVITRGDNNQSEDPYLVEPEAIVGQVMAAQRKKSRRHIAGGWQGIAALQCARKKRWLLAIGARLLGHSYHSLARTGIPRRFLSPVFHPRVVSFGEGYRRHMKLMMGDRVIGQYDTRGRWWRIYYPFSLFVDEAALPANQIVSVQC